MATVSEVYELWLSVDIDQLAHKTIEECSDDIIRENQEQMYMGQNAEGGKIGYYHSEEYAELKHSMNPLPAFRIPDLHLTGAFYSGMKLVFIGSNQFTLTSGDEKTPELEEKYGGYIFGIGEKSTEYLSEEIVTPKFAENFKKEVKL